MKTAVVLAEGVASTKTLLARYLAGFDDSNHVRQAPGLPNHVAWTLGHLAHTMQRMSNAFLTDPATIEGPLPSSDFVTGDGTRGDAQRFDAESVSFGSKPVADASKYPGYARCVTIFEAAVERMAGLVRECDDAKLERTVKWGATGMVIPLHQLAHRMIFHNGAHTGQIADLRRALGFKSIFS